MSKHRLSDVMNLPNELLAHILSLLPLSDLRLVCKEWMSVVHEEFIMSARKINRYERRCADSTNTSLQEVLRSRAKRTGVSITEDQLQKLSTTPRIVKSFNEGREGARGCIGPLGCGNYNGVSCRVYPRLGPVKGEAHVPSDRSPTFDDLY